MTLLATPTQLALTQMGYVGNTFARKIGCEAEHLSRPMKEGGWREVAGRLQRIILILISIPLAAVLALPSTACYVAASSLGEGRLEWIRPKRASEEIIQEEEWLKVASMNVCFQNPWAPLTGGVVNPHEPVGDRESRIEALAREIDREDPDLILGQEFDDLAAQDKFREVLARYPHVVVDRGCSVGPAKNHSGTFAASKRPFDAVDFRAYPDADRAGLARWSSQGALCVTINGIRYVNVHLNYGDGPENQAARNRQLRNHVIPLAGQGPSLIAGDLNFDTAQVSRAESGLEGLDNALEGTITCTDEGKHLLRSKNRNPEGRPCGDCGERIDGFVFNRALLRVRDVATRFLRRGAYFLSDHALNTIRVARA